MTPALAATASFCLAKATSIRCDLVLSMRNITRWRIAKGSPAVKRNFYRICAWIVPATLWAAQAALGWPEVIGLLTKARTQATTCVQVLKSNGDKASIGKAQLTYGMAEGEMDGIIAGLTTALVQGGDPSSLPTTQTNLETAGKGLKEICDAAVRTVTPNTKGVWEELAKGRSSPCSRRFPTASVRFGRAMSRRTSSKSRRRSRSWRPPNGPSSATSPRNSRRPSGAGRPGLRPGVRRGSGPKDETDLYDRPTLAIDPGMHTASIRAQAVDAAGRFAVTGGDDRTVRIWSLAEQALADDLGSGRACKCRRRARSGDQPRWQDDRCRRPDGAPSWRLIRSIYSIASPETYSADSRRSAGCHASLTFSHDGRYLAATLGGKNGLRIFDRDKDWSETFRDDQYGDRSHGAAFAPEGRLATTSDDGLIRLYKSIQTATTRTIIA